MASFNRPEDVSQHYTFQELIERVILGYDQAIKISTSYDRQTEYTWMVSTPVENATHLSGSYLTPGEILFLVGMGILFMVCIFLLLLLALWYGHRFGGPLLHMLEWLQQLAEGQYAEPLNRKGWPKSRNK